MSRTRQCLHCGMSLAVPMQSLQGRRALPCPKCDEDLFAQGDGSTLVQDIAHHRETVPQAMDKLLRLLDRAWNSPASQVRVITGGGLIREEVEGHLRYLLHEGCILDLREEGGNRGALLVRLR